MPHIIKQKTLMFLFPLILLIVGLITHFIFIGHPNQVVFDEVHYGKAVNGYFTGKYFFTGHPPLGPELIALGAWIGGYKNIGFSFDHIGQTFPNSTFITLRFMPALAGTFLPLVIYFLLLTLGLPAISAFAGGLLLNLDNALIVESHNAFITIFVIFFGFLGLLFFIKSRQNNYSWLYIFFAGISLGLSLATEWTAAGFFIFVGSLFLIDFILICLKHHVKNVNKIIGGGFIFIATVFLVYFAVFQIHFTLLPKSGTGDAFMSQKFLQGKLNPFEKFAELNITSYETNLLGLKATHPNSSRWDTWPIMQRSIFYWSGTNEKIYLLGNPILWWGSTIAVLIFLILFFTQGWQKNSTASLLLLGYISTYLPFIPVPRVLFLYHYFAPLIFAVMILVFLIDKLPRQYKIAVIFLYIIAVFISFLYFSPLTYGTKISDSQYQQRIWLETWR